ncbi:MAG: DEAD/DEAH box helicase family protein [Chloroflexi bacterium]|nr:DEAD/DEAH box helicase family protein [Chloroflexota bacterium]
MTLNESDTRSKLIDPVLHTRGWTEDLIRREETAGAVEISENRARRRSHGRVDYTLRVKVTQDSQPVAIGLIEAKAEHLPPDHGLEQAKAYSVSKRLNVPFVFSTNGHLFVMYDVFTGVTSKPRKLDEFPRPEELRSAYERGMGFTLDSEAAKPLLTRYSGGEATRRYYQDAAIRAVFEKIAKGDNRALLSLATGAGKTFIAVNLLKRIADAGQLRRALFICDRDELRAQGLAAFQNVFGADAAAVVKGNPQKNARILIATYQTLDVDTEEADANFLKMNYPENYFSHIIIDECHRSAWGKWSEVLKRNPAAVQVGLTATPRQLKGLNWSEFPEDDQVTADNIHYFGEPVYEYDMSQGMDDGYLAACEIIQRDIFLDEKPQSERETGVEQNDLKDKTLTDPLTGEAVDYKRLSKKYSASSFEDRLQMPDRVQAMCEDLFDLLMRTGGPEQKTIIFCARDPHADKVAIAMNNLYAAWCKTNDIKQLQPYAFKCTAASSGNDQLADLRGASRSHFIATTVDLLSTGVDVPVVQNIVFFKYVQSPIAFYQMVGRGTRLHPPSGKLMFRVYDYTDVTRLFGQAFLTRFIKEPENKAITSDPKPFTPPVQVEGFEVTINEAGKSILTMVDGKAMPVTVEEYKERLTCDLVTHAPTLDDFRRLWVDPSARHDLLDKLPDGARSALLVRALEDMDAFDLYDVLGELGYGLNPRTRLDRAAAFTYKHSAWLNTMPKQSAETLRALALQFGRAGTDGLESPHIFDTPEVEKAGGLIALRAFGQPAEILRETKARIFAA